MKEDIKNIIKQTVDNHTDGINPDVIWSGIEDKLGKKKKKRFLGYWIFSGLSLITAILIYTFIWSSQDDIKTSKFVDATIDVELKQELIVEEGSQGVLELDKSINRIANESKIEASEKIKEIESISDNQKINNASNSIVNETNVTYNNLVDKNKYNLGLSNLDENESIEYTSNFSSVTKSVNNFVNENAVVEVRNREEYFVVKSEQLKFGKFEIEDRVVEIESHEFFAYDYPKVANENAVSLLSGLELYTGLSLGNKTVSDVDQAYADSRNSSERLLEQWNVGLRFDLLKVMDFQLQSGVRYAMITDRMQMLNEYKDLTEYTYIKSRLINDEIVVLDSMVVVVDSMDQSFAYSTEQYNSQRLITIPLEISFGKSFDKLNLGFGFGVDVNYQLADTHVILNPEGKASINKVGGKWVSPSFSGALLVGYNLNDKWSINSRINFRGLSLSDHQSISTLNSNYKLYGLELGIKMNLKK